MNHKHLRGNFIHKSHRGRRFFLIVIIIIAATALAACDDSSDDEEKTVKIGVLNSVGAIASAFDGLKAGMVTYNYIEGEEVEYIYAGATNDTDVLAANAQALVEADVDVIFSITTGATTAAQTAVDGKDIPVVFVAVRDPVASGFAETLQQPGLNMTGVLSSGDPVDAISKRFEYFREVVPEDAQIWVPYEPSDSLTNSLAALETLAEAFGAELIMAEAADAEEIPVLLESIPAEADGIFWIGGRTFVGTTGQFIEAATTLNIPISLSDVNAPAAGAFMAYGTAFDDSGQQAARLVDQVLKGTKAGDLPIEQPNLLLVVNMEVADSIELFVPETLLARADRILRAEATSD